MKVDRLKDILGNINRINIQDAALRYDRKYCPVIGVNIDAVNKRVYLVCGDASTDDWKDELAMNTEFIYNALCLGTNYFDVYVNYAVDTVYHTSELKSVHVHFEYDTLVFYAADWCLQEVEKGS